MVKMCCYCCSRIILCVCWCMFVWKNPSVVETTELPPCNCLLRFLSCLCLLLSRFLPNSIWISMFRFWMTAPEGLIGHAKYINRQTNKHHPLLRHDTAPHVTTRDNIESVSMLLYQYWYTFTCLHTHTHTHTRLSAVPISLHIHILLCNHVLYYCVACRCLYRC